MLMKAALHIHSVWSYDGRWTLDQIVRVFSKRGYNLLFVVEHDQGFSEERRRAHRAACEKASTGDLLIVPGIEYSDSRNIVHTLVWGDVPFLGAGQETQRVLEGAAGRGGVCVFAHPSRRAAWQIFRKDWVKYLSGIEVWNRKTDGWSPSRDAERLVAETGVPPVVGMDFHSPKELFPLALHLQGAGRIEERAALEALRLGAYRCEAFGKDLRFFTNGVGAHAAGLLESTRREAARHFHFLRRYVAKAKAAPGSGDQAKHGGPVPAADVAGGKQVG
jgi:hypothetical protein